MFCFPGVKSTWICAVIIPVKMEDHVRTVVMVCVTHVSASQATLETTVRQTSVSVLPFYIFLCVL